MKKLDKETVNALATLIEDIGSDTRLRLAIQLYPRQWLHMIAKRMRSLVVERPEVWVEVVVSDVVREAPKEESVDGQEQSEGQ